MKEHFALVTGASSGMGLEFAKQLAQRGYNLLIVSNVGDDDSTQNVCQAVMELIQEGRYDEARIKADEAEYSWEQRELNEIIDRAQNE